MVYVNRGIARSNSGDHQGAIQDTNQAIQLNPEFLNAYIIRGIARAQLGDDKGGFSDFRRASTLAQQQNDQSYYDLIQKIQADLIKLQKLKEELRQTEAEGVRLQKLQEKLRQIKGR